MNSFELNKIFGAVLGTLTLVMGLNILSEVIFTQHKPAVPGYDLPQPEAGAAAPGAAAPAPAEPLPVLLAKADPARGEKAVAKCKACHVFEKGGPNKVGPDLYGVIDRPVAAHEGFNYSAALKSKGGKWDFEAINAFIANPKQAVPGTIMAFAGIAKPEERADILAYLRTLAESPVPLPAAK